MVRRLRSFVSPLQQNAPRGLANVEPKSTRVNRRRPRAEPKVQRYKAMNVNADDGNDDGDSDGDDPNDSNYDEDDDNGA